MQKSIEQMRADLSLLSEAIADPGIPEDEKAEHREAVKIIEAAIRKAEADKITAQSREAVARITGASLSAPNLPQVERKPHPAPTPQPQPETRTAPNVEPTAPRVEAKTSQVGRPASEWNPEPAPVGEMGRVRTAAPVRASAEALPADKKQLPSYFCQRFNETVDLKYTRKGLYHLLPEYLTFIRAVESYRALCQYWNIDVTPADVDLSWSRMSEPNQAVRRRVWEEIVKAAKNPQP
jgi:hypothetical protein